MRSDFNPDFRDSNEAFKDAIMGPDNSFHFPAHPCGMIKPIYEKR